MTSLKRAEEPMGGLSDAAAAGSADSRWEMRLDLFLRMSHSAPKLSGEQEVCDFVCNAVAAVLDCARVSIMLFDAGEGVLRIAGSTGIPKDIASQAIVRPGTDNRPSAEAFRTGRAVFKRERDSMPAEPLGVPELAGVHSFMSLPLFLPSGDGGSVKLGVMNFTRKIGGGDFTDEDLRLVEALAGHVAAQVHKCRLLQGERQRQRLEHEVSIAADIQLSLLPEAPMEAGSLQVACVCRPATNVGGDFVDYWVQEGRVCMLVADVSGHDLGAGLMATAVRAVIRTESHHSRSVAAVASRANGLMNTDLNRSERLATLCYAQLDLGHGVLTSCSCGHPFPLILRDGKPIWLKEGAGILGILPEMQFEESSIKLQDGDVLVVYTDGVVEAGLPERKQFGVEGVMNTLLKSPHLEPYDLAGQIVRAVQEHVGALELYDDATVLVGRYRA